MTGEEAASLLGIRADADATTIRHAWRVWARLAHPDTGGDPDHFVRLDEARRVLLHADAQRPLPAPPEPAPREPLIALVRRPPHARAVALLGVGAVLLAVLPRIVPAPLVFAAMPAAFGAAAWAAWATGQVLATRADPGHRIMGLAALWLPVAASQLALSLLAGASLLPVLPLVALPLAAAVSAVNPGAGLWRPVGVGATRDV